MTHACSYEHTPTQCMQQTEDAIIYLSIYLRHKAPAIAQLCHTLASAVSAKLPYRHLQNTCIMAVL